jgi:5-formyltetrahydrofolate cyclo-ligase
MNSKKYIRDQILEERKGFDEYKFHVQNELIIENINIIVKSLYKDLISEEKRAVKFKTHNIEILDNSKIVGLYLPIKGEPDLTKIMLYNNWIFALPKIEDNKIKFVHYQLGAKLEKTAKSIMQPISDVNVQPIIIIVPALAYSLQGYRLGFGSGHYDRYFAEHTDFNNKKPIIKIGVCFDKYLLEFLPTESHDIKFDYIVTDEIILKL